MGLDLATGAVRNYSNSPVYEEVEGLAPDGAWALVERDLESTAIPGPLDIWRLSLDGSSTWERLTFFNRYRGGCTPRTRRCTAAAGASPSSCRSTARPRAKARAS